MGHWLRGIAFVLLLSVVTLGLVTARVMLDGEQAMAASDAAFDRGALHESILLARRAASHYAPGAPHVTAAYERLAAVAIGAEAAGDRETARRAWEAMRGAALETRHVWVPRSRELGRANHNLARLSARGAGQGPRERAAELLARDDAPRAAWIVVLGLGWGLTMLGFGAVAWPGSSGDRISSRRLLLAALLAAIGVACWTLAVYQA